jgi:Zn-dependent protease with chaperone function
MNRRILFIVIAFLCLVLPAAQAQKDVDLSESQMPSVVTVPPEALPSDHFSADAATDAYLAQIPASARARSDAYFEGGYWLILWDFLMAMVIYWVILRFGWSAKMRDVAARISRFAFLQDMIYWVQFLMLTTILGAPLAIYEGYFREHKYGLATQTFGPWLGDQAKALLVNLILGGILLGLLFWIVRKLPRTWHIWGAIVTICFSTFAVMIAPVFIFPLFNKITRLDDPKVTTPILAMARANGIPANDVFKIDASKQSTRMSANVSGFGKTMRITLNDNLLRRGSPEEIQAVMGHEMGHYVLNHIYKDILFFALVTIAFFALLRWALDWSLARWRTSWGIRGIGDVAVLPLVLYIITVFGLVFTPIGNTQTRTEEHEADRFGINASRQPDGFAQAAIHLGEYRKMSPGPIEEFIFYDHPSGRRRIHDAMQWKAENLQLFQH